MAEKVFVNCGQGGVVNIHVKDGKVVRVRPLVFNESDPPTWKINARGKTFQPFRKVCLASYSLTERARLYSANRIKYPMVRVDFDPNGERNPQNRGKSQYRRISWDEALDLVSNEMKRIRTKYGPEAIMSRPSSHHNWGNIGYRMQRLVEIFQSDRFY